MVEDSRKFLATGRNALRRRMVGGIIRIRLTSGVRASRANCLTCRAYGGADAADEDGGASKQKGI